MITKIKCFKHIKKFFYLIALAVVLPAYSFAQTDTNKAASTTEPKKESKFNAGDMIIEHVSDAHSWHFGGNVSVPLPIILYVKNEGLVIFSSARLEDGATYKGFAEREGKIVRAVVNDRPDSFSSEGITDFSITKDAATIILVGFLLLVTFLGIAKSYKQRGMAAPKGAQSLFEPIIMFIRDDLAIPSIGRKKHEKFMPYLLTLFFTILYLNLLGLMPFFPGGANVTGNIGITMTLACFTFIVMMANSGKAYWSHTLWMPGVPTVVKILILGPIETLGIILKPFTLLIRIFANILAGHIVALSFFSLIFIFGAMSAVAGYGVSVVSVIFTIIMLLLDTLVALIQAYVFTLLSAMYFGMATEEAEHHH